MITPRKTDYIIVCIFNGDIMYSCSKKEDAESYIKHVLKLYPKHSEMRIYRWVE